MTLPAHKRDTIERMTNNMSEINQENMNSIILVVPTIAKMEEFNRKVECIFQLYKSKTQENEKLTELQSLLLAKMGQ